MIDTLSKIDPFVHRIKCPIFSSPPFFVKKRAKNKGRPVWGISRENKCDTIHRPKQSPPPNIQHLALLNHRKYTFILGEVLICFHLKPTFFQGLNPDIKSAYHRRTFFRGSGTTRFCWEHALPPLHMVMAYDITHTPPPNLPHLRSPGHNKHRGPKNLHGGGHTGGPNPAGALTRGILNRRSFYRDFRLPRNEIRLRRFRLRNSFRNIHLHVNLALEPDHKCRLSTGRVVRW